MSVERTAPRMVIFPKLHLSMLSMLGLFLLIAIAITSGAVSIPLTEALSEQHRGVLLSIRLPRVLLAVIVGSALAVSGAAMQGLFRNPLADPGLIGISSGAAFAVACLVVLIGPVGGTLGLYGVSVAAFLGGALTAVFIFYIARVTGGFSMTYMLLAGIAINALAGAGVGFLTYLSDDQQLRTLTFWTMGSLGGALWPAVVVAATIVFPALFVLIRCAKRLNLLLLGEREAAYLGVESKRLKLTIVICAALSVGAAVAVSGVIGFVGLVVPHVIRLMVGPDHRVLIPLSAILGAGLLLLADTIARLIVLPAEMPVGILTSLIGGPFFLWLLVKQYSGRFGL